MSKRKKIRFKNWYWGKFIYEGDTLDNTKFTLASEGFEVYVEELHGWHHSEEHSLGYDSNMNKLAK